MSRTLKLTLAYDGTELAGWQRQAGAPSVQGLLEEALGRIDDAPVTVVGAGRTDAGVHAAGQAASVRVTSSLDPATMRRALNAVLPAHIRILTVQEAPPDFNARFHATLKTYDYRIANGPVLSPFARRFCWHVPQPLDVEAMDRAAGLLRGRHDFASFQGAGSSVATSVRTLVQSTVTRVEASADTDRPSWVPPIPIVDDTSVLVRYRIAGDGFLRHMVRNIVGTLVEIGLGKRNAASLKELLEARDRSAAGPKAPAHGLCLVRIDY